ncbi:benzoate 4-monooxygenase cytochrome P450 [Stachybotrys elegans]|uniref:Benzoate 4-monooxygenase cytochrome P450 n=1 Tax=Stachybotrys elegans TaxID=80388 RepID=A0A8K0SPG7_9HYPO|nr:benzoate 4-monooxygenase cytochrome P450 [Stachybotrys elegans]
MLNLLILSATFMQSLLWLCAAVTTLFIASALYNVYFHPLRKIPGPFWAKASEIPSWYHAAHGKRHIWLWQLFQIYGNTIRVGPNLVLFCDPEAYSAIYNMKSNVRRSVFYEGLTMNMQEKTTLNTIDPAEHAERRKKLNTCFTENSVNFVSAFISKHVDRWHHIMLDEHNSVTEWSNSIDFGQKLDHLIFDIMGDLSFGRSFDLKETGENPLREVPQNITQYLKFYYPICRSPLLSLLIWLKPRGLDWLMQFITPRPVQEFNEFVSDSTTKRLELYKKQEGIPEHERRRDMFYYLCKAHDPDTGLPAFNEDELRAEAAMFIVAGSDTTAVSLSGIFWYLIRAPRCYQKLVEELQRTFASANDIVYGPKLTGCTYMRACIDEGMRLVPPGPCELPREVLAGGLEVLGTFYPAGTIVGTAPWCDSRNADVYGDPGVFRPERWIVDEAAGTTKEMVAKIRTNFHPFLAGPGICAGRNVAMAEMMLIVAKTIFCFDLRKAPGSTLGEGRPELGWGQRERDQLQVVDAYISIKQGPVLQFRKRATSQEVLTKE